MTSQSNPLYALRLLAPGKFQLAKFDEDFNVAACYDLEAKGHSYTCNCPANNRSVVTRPCKHKRMMPYMLGAANTDRFYDPITGSWHQPLGDLDRPQAADLAGREALPPQAGSVGASAEAQQDEPYGSMLPETRELIDNLDEYNKLKRAMLKDTALASEASSSETSPAAEPSRAQPKPALAGGIRRR